MFNDLKPSDYDNLIQYFKAQSHRLCYYSLSSLIVWNHHISKPVWKIVDDILITGMVFFEKPGNNYLLLPLSAEKKISPSQLWKIANSSDFSKFHFVPEDYISGHNYTDVNDLFIIVEQPRYEDYIYNTQDLAGLKGKKYSKKRNLINQFKKNYGNNYKIEAISDTDIPECIEFLDIWADSKKYDVDSNEDASGEKQAAKNALQNINKLGLSGIVLRIDGKVKAFGIGSKLTNEIGGFHFEKADSNIKGLYQFFDQQCAQRLFSGFKFINKECDMGDQGLKHAKRSYYPETTVKSFKLFLK